jgi:hypothetical protein
MWFLNKIVNPLIRWILNSPLHQMMSSSVLLFTYRGNKSGKTYQIPVQYAQEGKLLYIIPGAAEVKTWWRNFRISTPVQVILCGEIFTGNAVVLNHENDKEAIIKGVELYLKHFPSLLKSYNIRVEKDGSFNHEDIYQRTASIEIIQVILDNR